MKLPYHRPQARRAATAVFFAVVLVATIGLMAFGIDLGYIVLVRTQLQAAADSAAMAAGAYLAAPPSQIADVAREYAGYHYAGGKPVQLNDKDVEFGIWDASTRKFTPQPQGGNAVRITARRSKDTGGEAPLFFARIFGRDSFPAEASAVAMANPRDIAFVVDLSGSMNDDTEPAWATGEINTTFGPQGYPNIGTDVMKDVYKDFSYGSFPGTLEHVGAPLKVKADKYAYAELTKNGGPLDNSATPSAYRISSSDNEAARKKKAYSWIIDKQIAVVMPKALPAPNSSNSGSYAYWEKYLDYLMESISIVPPKPPSPPSGGGGSGGGGSSGGGSSGGGSGGGSGGSGGSGGGGTPPPPPPPKIGKIDGDVSELFILSRVSQPLRTPNGDELLLAMGPSSLGPQILLPQLALGAGPGTPPDNRGTLPPSQDSDRIDQFNNPNTQLYPKAKISVPRSFRNKIGYRTYVQFMMDHGRDLKPDGSLFVPLSTKSPNCPYHSEDTAGGTFDFPPRSQPEHATRRSLIAGLEIVKQRNDMVPDKNQRDWVSIVTFDSPSGTAIHQSLTGDYDSVMDSCTKIQAVGDKGATTATESGMIAAKQHIRPTSQGGAGRKNADKVVVVLTDGVPNAYASTPSAINNYIAANPSSNFFANGAYWYDGPIMQAAEMHAKKWDVHAVGLGLGTDYNFMDRLARAGGTADAAGQCPRGTGNPAQYEQILTEIFKKIIENPQPRLVQ